METTINRSADVQNVIFAQTLLKFTFGLVPIVAGLDKFTNILTHWVNYLNPHFASMMPLSGEAFMKLVGVIEIIAGLLVLFKTRIGSLIVSVWLVLIALQLLVSWMYPDVAVRDLVMAISAFVLFKLSSRAV